DQLRERLGLADRAAGGRGLVWGLFLYLVRAWLRGRRDRGPFPRRHLGVRPVGTLCRRGAMIPCWLCPAGLGLAALSGRVGLLLWLLKLVSFALDHTGHPCHVVVSIAHDAGSSLR